MAIDLTTLFSSLGIVSGNTNSKNQYEFYNGITWDDLTITYNQKEFFDKVGLSRYDFYKQYTSERQFYLDIDDTRINDYSTFYQFGGEYLSGGDPQVPPTAAFTSSTQSTTPDTTITFTNTSTGTAPISYTWDFGDGNIDVTENPTHSYSGTGSYTITLTASNTYGVSSATSSVDVETTITDYIPNYFADSWIFDQTQAEASVPNGGFIYPRQYIGETMSITGLGTWNAGLTHSDFVSVGLPFKNSAATLVGMNCHYMGQFNPSAVSGQNPGIYHFASEDTLTNTVQIQALYIYATQSSLIKAINNSSLPATLYSTATTAVTFEEDFDDANYSIILPYGRNNAPNLKSAMDGWYVSSKTTSGFTVNRGSMNSTLVGSGIIAVASGTDNAYFKNGSLTPATTTTNISFTTPFDDADYAVFMMVESNITPGTSYIYGITGLTAGGFNLNLSSAFYVPVTWTAVKLNYTNNPSGISI